ncbi:hypothetical protein FAIPA1_590015 [Frankia sp. AiPs1]
MDGRVAVVAMDDQETVSDELWARMEPLVPRKPRRFDHPVRRPVDDRAALNGILWVLVNDVPW